MSRHSFSEKRSKGGMHIVMMDLPDDVYEEVVVRAKMGDITPATFAQNIVINTVRGLMR